MGSLLSEASNADLASQIGEEYDELNPIVPQTATTDTSVSKGVGQGAAKTAKKKQAA